MRYSSGSTSVLDIENREDRRWTVTTTVLHFLLMVAVIVTVDVLFLRNRFWIRLFTNIGVVALFLVLYLVVVR